MLVVQLQGADRLSALKGQLEIRSPTSWAEKVAGQWRLFAWRLGGTHTSPAGRFYSHGKRVFWDVHHAEKAIAIELRDEHFDRLVVEVADPEAVIATILEALPVRVS